MRSAPSPAKKAFDPEDCPNYRANFSYPANPIRHRPNCCDVQHTLRAGLTASLYLNRLGLAASHAAICILV